MRIHVTIAAGGLAANTTGDVDDELGRALIDGGWAHLADGTVPSDFESDPAVGYEWPPADGLLRPD